MTDAPLSYVSSADGTSWTEPKNIVNGYSDYGLQMHVYRGELYGVMTQTLQYPKQMFVTKYKIDEGWKTWRSLPEKWYAQGRVSVTTLEDRFYILRRGTDDANYLCWTDNFTEWHDLGRVGSKYAQTKVAPAICAHDGRLVMAGVGDDKYIYYCVADKDGKRDLNWTKIPGTGTQSALSMGVYDGNLFLFHTGYNNDKFFFQTMTSKGWSQLSSVNTNITSGISTISWKMNELAVTYRGKDQDIKVNAWNGDKWVGKTFVPNVYMKYQTGLATWGGRLVISYAAVKKQNSTAIGYSAPDFMNEKSGIFAQAQEMDEEWECKWDETKQQKTWVRKLFCL